jgi:hypothetical protein
MFGGSGGQELGYANAAVTISLIRELVRRQIFPPESAEQILSDAIGLLSEVEHVTSICAAIGLLRGEYAKQIKED